MNQHSNGGGNPDTLCKISIIKGMQRGAQESLDEEKRTDGLHLFAEKIASRYIGSNPMVASTNPALLAERSAPAAIDADSNVETPM
jgi:hypothetical protein